MTFISQTLAFDGRYYVLAHDGTQLVYGWLDPAGQYPPAVWAPVPL